MNISHFSNIAGIAAFSLPSVHKDIQEAARQNKSTLWAGVKSAARNNFSNLLLIGTQRAGLAFSGILALQMAPSIVGAGYALAHTNANNFRIATVPFSSRFEMSDIAASHQAFGLSSINGANARFGAEASKLAQRYGSRGR